MNELLNCPFCGGEAKYMEIKDFFISRFVTCTKCGIETPRNCLNRKDAIKRWNTRKPMDNIVEKLEEKTEFLKDCTKYGNKDAEQQEKSYSTMMMYEVADLVDDLIDIVKQEINNGLE